MGETQWIKLAVLSACAFIIALVCGSWELYWVASADSFAAEVTGSRLVGRGKKYTDVTWKSDEPRKPTMERGEPVPALRPDDDGMYRRRASYEIWFFEAAPPKGSHVTIYRHRTGHDLKGPGLIHRFEYAFTFVLVGLFCGLIAWRLRRHEFL